VGVADPRDPARDRLVLAVRDRGVATSTSARRRWRRGGRELHHLIDPRTGLPSASDVASATVVAPTVARAEVLAKVALLLGPAEGRRLLEASPDAAGLLVLRDGRVLASARLREVIHAA
jgi:thiamine biosynthesis lipoprotein